jgi:geranyl-CoA carboxylase alpha subunit
MKRFDSILVANRGEIACRVLRSAKTLGYKTVAIYSDPDANAPHVHLADQAYRVGPGPVSESYLEHEAVINAALDSGACAIHPGYGFLSENAAFAEACNDRGLIFIGPTSEAIAIMGDKAQSKRRVLDVQVPCIPGYQGEDQTDSAFVNASSEIEFPVMIKAAAGGGGRGMRQVDSPEQLINGLALARAEANSAFGSDKLILEKVIKSPRHIEIQIFADEFGNIIHMGERDCSVQRRYQKVIEEAPCPVMTLELREIMGKAAIKVAKTVNYRGAGTVEFLLDESEKFYFLEMNTRLQVEHPVTESITGLDLVALQISVAQGETLPLTQEEVSFNGHAIEARLYAEEPSRGFLPATGKVDLWSPAEGLNIRIDDGIKAGQNISPFYDPMLAKIICSGSDRETARKRLVSALKETALFGISTNREFLIDCLEKETFVDGNATTGFISEEFEGDSFEKHRPTFKHVAIASVIELVIDYRKHHQSSVLVSPELKDWTNVGALASRKYYQFDEVIYDLHVSSIDRKERYLVRGEEQSVEIKVHHVDDFDSAVSIENRGYVIKHHSFGQGFSYMSIEGREALYRDLIQRERLGSDLVGEGRTRAPMHGLLLKVQVEAGESVKKGQTVAVLEAMKMHYEISSEVEGLVSEVHVSPGDQVAADQLLIDIETN